MAKTWPCPLAKIDDKAAIESRKTGTEDESKVSGREAS